MSETTDDEARSNRAIIFDVAKKEFAESGFAGTPVSRIAAGSGLNKQLIYHYFGSKRGLYEAVMEEAMAGAARPLSFESMFGMSGDEDSPDDVHTWFRLYGWEGLQQDPADVPYMDLRRGYNDRLEQLIRTLQDEGVVRADIEPRDVMLLLAMSFIGPHVMPQLTASVLGELSTVGDAVQRLEGLVRRLLAPASATQNSAQP